MLLCLTANHRNASFDLLEKLSIGAPSLATSLVTESDFIQGAVVLATCNRFEAYLDVDEPLTAAAALAAEQAIEVLAEASVVDVDDVRSTLTVLCGDTVAEHLFSVSSGLESVAIGEDEIAGQVRRALTTARIEHTTSSDLERLFQRASKTSRGVKTKTGLGGAGRSLVRLALDLAESRVTDWAGTTVLLVGTGRYARASLAALRDRGVTNVRVYSPSGRAANFAASHQLQAVAKAELVEAIAASDVIVTCSTAPTVVLTAEQLVAAADIAGAVERRLVIDLGLPRNVDPAVATVAGTELLDLETVSLHAPLEELNAESHARALVGEAAAEYRASRAEAEVAPAVVALRSHLFDLLDAEIARARSRGDSSDETERALRHLVGVILHTPSVRARELARTGGTETVFAAVEALFGLQASPAAAADSNSVEAIVASTLPLTHSAPGA
ncbi:glutamyl-tRNA reductase [Agreia bicolorata]|uniref:glutamyl-tRNA reductase n=1 Tax=Agreia bicolorata TaxID=110935 RepID=UPI0005C927D3|nr:glutamyl-tRNA reductase [Agreia bicolorata]